MKAVSNTSPIIFLSKLNALGVLLECFEEMTIPQAVKAELDNLKLPDEIRVQSISAMGAEFVAGAFGRLHHGELEAMILAKETCADFVLLDDLLARRKAQRLGLPVMGTLGVIMLAHQQKKIAGQTAIAWLDELSSSMVCICRLKCWCGLKPNSPIKLGRATGFRCHTVYGFE